jgi:Na+/proline symporter
MSALDWFVLLATVVGITGYGLWKSRKQQNLSEYFSGHTLPWYTISLSVISTQASAVTFLSAPGQAYSDGMRFVLFYLGLPLAMIVVSTVMLPRYYKLNILTAYEFLETKFDMKVRVLTAFFFLIQRSLAAGISIAAPTIVLSVMLGWNTYATNIFTGGLVIFYILWGGSMAISQTQKLQMLTILIGMAIAGYLVVALLPKGVSFTDAMHLAGEGGKLNTMNFEFKWDDRYNIWSGLIGGFFLQLAYFGTDQSQVGRYITGSSMTQSRLGLLFNGLFKIPMQFGILFIGAMLYAFYQFYQPPIFFNPEEVRNITQKADKEQLTKIENTYKQVFEERKEKAQQLLETYKKQDTEAQITASKKFKEADEKMKGVRKEYTNLMKKTNPKANTNDTNYIFLTFVNTYMPMGLIGLLVAVILFASMSTTASELNALASTTTIDIYKRALFPNATEEHYLAVSKYMIFFWGILAIIIAQFSLNLGTLIEVVNMLGSWFYGSILGVFLLAFFSKGISSNAVFVGAIVGEVLVISLDFGLIPNIKIAYLWLNMVGCLAVITLSYVFEIFFRIKKHIEKSTQ